MREKASYLPAECHPKEKSAALKRCARVALLEPGLQCVRVIKEYRLFYLCSFSVAHSRKTILVNSDERLFLLSYLDC